jgi:hypothetical protein
MKLPQFRVRTLLLLTAIMGVVFVACAKWPVTEMSAPPPASGVAWFFRYEIKRPPTFTEWAIRASIASAILLAVFVLIGAWRGRRATDSALCRLRQWRGQF